MNKIKSSQTHINKELVAKFRLLIKEFNINLSMSDELLMCFINARKNDLSRAVKLLNNYLRMTKNYPQIYTDMRPARVKNVLDMGIFLSSPYREKNGSRILILNLHKWDLRSCSLEDIMSAVVFCFQRMVSETETQTNGIVAIIDVKDFALQHLRQFTPPLIKVIAETVQNVFPIRLKGIHVLHEPRIIKILLTLFWPFLSNKIRDRLFFHGDSYATMHQHIDPACLPSNYNGYGCLKNMETMHFSNVFFEENYSKIFDCFN